MGPSTPSWGITKNKTEIIMSNPLSLFMYVTSLTCDFGASDEEMVVYLTRLTLSALENASNFYFAVAYLGCVSSGRISLEML